MNIEFDKLIEECNSKRSNIYYRLNQLTDITGLCQRMLKYRMKAIKLKYKNIPSLLRKNGKRWQIHISIINDFLPKRSSKKRTVNTYGWKNFVTWNLKNNYSVAYHVELIEQIKSKIYPLSIKYTIEADRRGIKHVHFITDAEKEDLKKIVREVLDNYLTRKEYLLEVNDINNNYSSIQYVGKSPLDEGIL